MFSSPLQQPYRGDSLRMFNAFPERSVRVAPTLAAEWAADTAQRRPCNCSDLRYSDQAKRRFGELKAEYYNKPDHLVPAQGVANANRSSFENFWL